MNHASRSSPITRRHFLQTTLAGGAGGAAVFGALSPTGYGASGGREPEGVILGHGEFRYRVVPDWGQLGPSTPVNNCHGIVCDSAGNIVLLTDHAPNNVIAYDKSGRLLNKWGAELPGAHGLSLVKEGVHERLYMTCLQTHRVVKYSLEGEKLAEWLWPEQSGKYTREGEYRPSWTLHLSEGVFFVLDGYGRDYITQYGADGQYTGIFGGAEGGIAHWGPHGGMIDLGANGAETLLLAMSDQQSLLRLSRNGEVLAKVTLPGGNPRQIRKQGKHYFVAHLGDQWPKDRNSRGFVSVLDEQFRVVANIGGTKPEYGEDGVLVPMAHVGEVFMHPHDLAVGEDGSLYVAQFASGKTYPIKLERV